MKLGQKIFLGLLILAVPLVVVIGLVIYTLTRSTLQRNQASQQLVIAQETLNKIDRLLYERYVDIRTIASDKYVQDSLTNQVSPSATDSANLKQRMEEFLLITGPWNTLEIIDAQKNTIFAVGDEEGHELNAEHLKLIDKALAGSVSYSDVFPTILDGKPTMGFAAPIKDMNAPDRPIIGVVVGHLSWPVVLEIIQNTGAHTIKLFSSQGVELGDNKVEDNAQALTKTIASNSLFTEAKSQRIGFTINSNLDENQSEPALITYVTEEGFLSYRGNGWLLFIETPVSVAFNQANQLAIGFSLAIGLMVMIGALIALYSMDRFLVTRIVSLTSFTQAFAQGNLNERLKVTSQDELGKLAAAFNTMADSLQESYNNLEKKVDEKTADIANIITEIQRARAADDALLANLSEGMMAIDPQAQIIKINSVAKQFFGLDDNCINKKISECVILHQEKGEAIPPDQHPALQALQTKQLIEDIYYVQSPNGERRALTISANPVQMDDELIGVIIVARDVTKEKEVDRMKTEFISLASHQLRTPLSAIKWFTEMLLSGDAGELNKEQADFAKNVSESTERMIQLVNSLLNISRIESGRIIIDPKPTDLLKLVEGVVNDLKAKIEAKKHNLIISVHKDLPMINLDPQLISQVYLNFLTNAIKYTPEGGDIQIFVSRKGDEVISQVTDSGYGIPEKEKARVFQKFFRAENIIKVEADGTGLGLYLVKAIIESSGGRVWFESTVGKGSTFWFSIPITGMKAKAGEVTIGS